MTTCSFGAWLYSWPFLKYKGLKDAWWLIARASTDLFRTVQSGTTTVASDAIRIPESVKHREADGIKDRVRGTEVIE